ncbi:MAG: hypothetical protein V7L27_16150 [Nostoc sp.]
MPVFFHSDRLAGRVIVYKTMLSITGRRGFNGGFTVRDLVTT